MAGSPVLQFTKTEAFRIAAIIAVLVGLYALAGFVLAPRLLRSTLMEDIPKTLGVKPTVGEIHINPFLFQVEVKDFSLTAPGGDKLLSSNACSSTSSCPPDLAPRLYVFQHRYRCALDQRRGGGRR